MIELHVHNARTQILGATEWDLELIDRVTSFLSNEALSGGQAKRYNFSDLEHAWDGWVRFLDRTEFPPTIPTGLRDLVYGELVRSGQQVGFYDFRQPPQHTFSPYTPIPLWPHQEEAKQAMLTGLDCVARMPPRSGKTRTLIEVVRESNLPTLWTAPTTSIVTQTVREAQKWLGPHDAVQVDRANQETSKACLLTVCTAATMMSLSDDFLTTRQQTVCDEVHHFLANKSWGKTLLRRTPHISARKGMTGTFFRSNGDDLALLAFIGRVGYSVDSQFLLDRQFLVPTYCCFVPIEGPKVKSSRRVGSMFLGPDGHGTLGIAQHRHRNDVVASTIQHLANLGRTVVVLVATKKQGREIADRLLGVWPKGNAEFEPVEFVSTDRPKPIIQKIYQSFVQHQEVRVLIGTSMVGEGVDLPPADALVYASGGKAAVPYVQSLYRVCTAHPGKQYGVVVDFIDRQHKGLLEHSRDRWRIASQDPVFRLSSLQHLSEFPGWAQNTVVAGS